MNKKITSYILSASILAFSLCGCSNANEELKAVPELSQVQNICELSVLECTFNNLAVSTKKAGTGFLHLGEKERKFWIEYKVKAKVSYDMDSVQMDISGNNVKITLPEPLLEFNAVAGNWKKIEDDDQFFQKNPITQEDEKKAVDSSLSDLQTEIEKNKSLLKQAEDQTESLIENYITEIGNLSNTTYNIEFETEKAVQSETVD